MILQDECCKKRLVVLSRIEDNDQVVSGNI